MNYKVKCPECNKKVKVSSHDSVKYYDKKTHMQEMSFDCPECEGEIILVQKIRRK